MLYVTCLTNDQVLARTLTMRRFASPTPLIKFVLLLCLATQVDVVVGRGPDAMPVLLVYKFSMSNCSMFRNEAVLRPQFGVWPEDIEGARFRHCCEYQSNGASAAFELSNYTYGRGGAALKPVPYYDIGIVENTNLKDYWRYWHFWMLPQKQSSEPLLYCDVTDLRALYTYRGWKVIMRRSKVWAVVVGPLALVVLVQLVLGSKRVGVGIYKAVKGKDRAAVKGEELKPSLEKEEAFADVCHIFLLTVSGTSLMEGIARSTLRSWRTELMFNAAVAYSYLTSIAAMSTLIRHCLLLRLRLTQSKNDAAWVWQKVFLQFVTQFTVGMYLVLVEDVTGKSLDAVCSLTLGTCVAAAVWSAGVDLVVMWRFCSFCWDKLVPGPTTPEHDTPTQNTSSPEHHSQTLNTVPENHSHTLNTAPEYYSARAGRPHFVERGAFVKASSV